MLSNVYGHFLNRFWPLFWKYRHFWDKDWAESYASEESLSHPHRTLLLEAVSKFEPFDSLIEYGSGPGANLYRISKRFPNAKLYGIDLSDMALKKGRELFKNNPKVKFLKSRPRGKLDLYLTDAFLIYKDYLAASHLIFKITDDAEPIAYIGCEWHDEKGTFEHGRHWVHNFKKLLPGCELRKLTWDDWQDEGWSTYGHIITWIR